MKITKYFICLMILLFNIVWANTGVCSEVSSITKLNGYSPNTQDDSDLIYFDKLIGDASVVGLGESTHGTSEFFQMKHRLLKHLVEKQGFTVFAMEESMPISSLLNQYVLTGTGDPKKILTKMNSPYATQEVLDLVEWLHTYNLTEKKKIQFAGFDMQDDEFSGQIIKTALEKSTIKSLQDTAKFIIDKINANKTLQMKVYNDNRLKKSPSILLLDIQNYVSAENSLHSDLTRFSKALVANKSTLNIEIGSSSYEWVLQNINILIQYSTFMPGTFTFTLPVLKSKYGPIDFRDKCMAQNILWIKKQNPGAKIVVWAHSGHIAAIPQIDSNTHAVLLTMGTHLRSTLENKYKAITFSTYQGTYTAYDKNTKKEKSFPLLIPPINSLESELNQICPSMALINLYNAANLPMNLYQSMPVRLIGFIGGYPQFQASINSAKAFDGIIYIRNTTGSKNFYNYGH